MSAAENLSSPIASAEHAQRQGPRRFGVPASPRRRPVRRWLRAQPHLLGRGDDAFSLSCASLKDGELLCSTVEALEGRGRVWRCPRYQRQAPPTTCVGAYSGGCHSFIPSPLTERTHETEPMFWCPCHHRNGLRSSTYEFRSSIQLHFCRFLFFNCERVKVQVCVRTCL